MIVCVTCPYSGPQGFKVRAFLLARLSFGRQVYSYGRRDGWFASAGRRAARWRHARRRRKAGRAQVGAGAQAVADDGDINSGVNVDGLEGCKAALAERDKRIAELEAQVADAAKSAETAESLTKQIEELKASNEAERIGFELRLAGVRSVTAAKALLGEHGGDVAKLKAAEPWLFADSAGGATGLEPAGVAKATDADMKRWRAIAGLED